MRKSIYFLLANTISLIAAAIFIGVTNTNLPYFGFDLAVFTLKSCWEPLKIVVAVETLSILFCVQDLVSYSEHCKTNTKVPFTFLKDVIMGVITVITILYTWVAVILEFDNYAVGQTISMPLYFIIFYVVGIVLILLSGLLAKKNATVGISLVFASILLMISGLLYECLPYLYTIIPAVAVSVLVFAIPSLISLTKKKA